MISWTAKLKNAPAFAAFIDPDDPLFFLPGSITDRMNAFCMKTGQAVPDGEADILRCILESISMKYRVALTCLVNVIGYQLEAIHVVGGGSRNRFFHAVSRRCKRGFAFSQVRPRRRPSEICLRS
jgi:sugar (pentulose or hexulose) kinase